MKIVKIKQIKEIESHSKRYDIQTKETNNFFANGILVHNSMIQVYWDWHLNKWFAGTTGTAEAEGMVNNKDNTTFSNLFWDTIADKYPTFRISWLDKTSCYVFELTTPYNIVVKPHSVSSVTLLTARKIDTLKEATRDELIECGKVLHLPVVQTFDLNAKNIGHLIKTFDNMPWSSEGYVVVDANHNRVKVKNPAYVNVHGLKGKSAEYNIMGIIVSNEIEEFAAVFPDRKSELFRLKQNYDNLGVKLNVLWLELEKLKPKNLTPNEKKRYAMEVFKLCGENDVKEFTGMFFNLAENKIASVDDFLSNYDKKKLYLMC